LGQFSDGLGEPFGAVVAASAFFTVDRLFRLGGGGYGFGGRWYRRLVNVLVTVVGQFFTWRQVRELEHRHRIRRYRRVDFLQIVEERVKLKVFLLRNRIVLVRMAVGAADG